MKPQSASEAIQFLSSLSPSAVRLGLDRIHAALRALGHPEANYATIHVAGTNGKGSTCAFASTVLHLQGYRVGLYTSPHLVRVNERIKVNGEDISDEKLGQRILEVVERYPQALESGQLTYFELGTLVAFWHFAREEVDVAVIETGLGGRLDATNACRPAVTAITPISLDHMDYLGHSVAAIAGEKAGIFKAGVPAVVASQTPEALEVLERVARQVGSPFKLEGRDFRLEPEGSDARTFTYRGMRTSVPKLWPALKGEHQVQNAAMAIACLELLEDRGIEISRESVRAGLAATEWPGRLEELPGRPPVLLDGAHNPAAVEVLVKALDSLYGGRKVHLVFGVLSDKDLRPMLRTLFPRCASAHLAPVKSSRSLDPQKYLDEAQSCCPDTTPYPSAPAALSAARKRAEEGDLVLCTGSLFLVGEIRGLPGRD